MTLIIMLILAGISLSGLIGEKGLFKRTEDASNIYNEKKAREVLETVLLTDGQFEKNTNPEYNQDDFLDELIKKEIPGSDIKGDIAIIGGEYAYELDRSVPKIGTRGNNGYLGNPKDLIFPVVTVAEITQADPEDNYRTAKIEITATIEEKAENGINRIEIWQNGVKLDTIDGKNEKNITTEYKANKNGVYTIKAYAKISDIETSGSARTTVEGIVPTVEFKPNGSTEWKKEHSTKIIVKETENAKVINMQYLWKKSSEAEPKAGEFTQSCTNNSTITGGNETMTGKYRLWVLVTLGTGPNQKTYVNGSEEFYFDNKGPNVDVNTEAVSLTVFNIIVNAHDEHTKVAKYNFNVTGKSPITNETNNEKVTHPVTGVSTGSTTFTLIVEDELGNQTIVNGTGTTKLYTWSMWDAITNTTYSEGSWSEWKDVSGINTINTASIGSSYTFDKSTGKFTVTGSSNMTYKGSTTYGYSTFWNAVSKGDPQRTIYEFKNTASHTAVGKYCREKSAIPTSTVKKGTTKYDDVTATSETAYPKNGASGSYWYEYKGIY